MPFDPAIPGLGIYPTLLLRMYNNIHKIFTFICFKQKLETTQCPSVDAWTK